MARLPAEFASAWANFGITCQSCLHRRCDMLIIGAGPTGLYAAYYAGFRGFNVAVIDALPEPGGQITAMYPERTSSMLQDSPRSRVERSLMASP